ncbi:MAG: membrane protein insertion efficiency factor YidD [Halanaerobiales bacterium]|jgi:putative membrane protein insertion efficiency factor|nr:membrane protein insertion efficiency factor YidD [Halanaerobiales bacterium]
MSKLILWLIKVYQKVISPWTPKTCRFHPTCSEYSYQAVKKYGAFKGGFKSIKRISKCHPFNSGGYDPLK